MKSIDAVVVKKSYVWLALVLLGFLAYHNVFSHPFVHDDFVFIVHNPFIQEFELSQIFQSKALGGHANSIINTYYRPLLECVYRILYWFFGDNASGYHITNIFLHVLNSILVYSSFRRLKDFPEVVAMAMAVLFVIHPIQTEAVACISGISNLIVTLFFLGAWYCFLRWRENTGRIVFLWSSLMLVFVGHFAKEQMIVAPLIFAFYVLLFEKKQACWKVFAWFLLPVVSYLALRKCILNIQLPSLFAHPQELWLRIQTIPKTLLTDLQLIIFPFDLHYYRSVDILAPVLMPTALFILAMFVIVVLQKTLSPAVVKWYWLGWGWFIVTLLPMLNILPLIQEYSLILTFEHFLYIPMLGVILSLSVLVYDRTSNLHVLQWALVILCGVLFLLTIQQNTYWRGEIPLFQRSAQYQSSGRVYHLLGKAYYFDKQYEQATTQIHRGIVIFKEYLEKVQVQPARQFYEYYLSDMYFDLGNSYLESGRLFEAEIAFTRSVQFKSTNQTSWHNLRAVQQRLKTL